MCDALELDVQESSLPVKRTKYNEQNDYAESLKLRKKSFQANRYFKEFKIHTLNDCTSA